MATYRLLSRIVALGPREHHVTVSAIPEDMRSAEVRSDTLPTAEEAQARRNFLVMSLATELRARGHQVAALVD